MSDPILVFDVSYLAHRAFYAMGDLAHGSEGTAVIFGLLRDVISLQDKFQTGRCVFAFDHPAPKHRQTVLPTYKSSRIARYEKEDNAAKQARKEFRGQLRKLYFQYLPAAGFKNVFAAPGFEADDIIAEVTRTISSRGEAVIISSDEDLWQCCSVRPFVSCFNPQKGKLITYGGFLEKWGFPPKKWAEVKAIAGCSTDDVPGVAGVGEVTAAKYLRGELGAHTKAYGNIKSYPWKDNLDLVQLPYKGTPEFELQEDEVTEEKWQALADSLGMHSIKSSVPRGAVRKSRGRKRNGKGKGFGLSG